MPKKSYHYEIVMDGGEREHVVAERHCDIPSKKIGRSDLFLFRGNDELGSFYAVQGWTRCKSELPARFIKADPFDAERMQGHIDPEDLADAIEGDQP